MPGWGLGEVAVGMPRHGRGPTMCGSGQCVVLAIRTNLVYGGVAGRPCCRIGCARSVSSPLHGGPWVGRLNLFDGC